MSELDVIELRGIRTAGKHGVTAAEREQSLPLELDISLQADLSKASRSDDLEDTIDYSKLHKTIVQVVSTGSRHLLERLTQDVLDALFEDVRIKVATVSIAKPQRLSGATPVVTLTRRNPRA